MLAYDSASITTQLARRFKSADSGGVKIDADQKLFDGAWFFVTPWTARALVNKQIALVKAQMEKEFVSREKDWEKQALTLEKELENQALTLKTQALTREKELETQALTLKTQALSREKELENQALTLKNQALTREKALEISIATLESGLFQARKETLRCKGLLTSRGVLESALVNIHAERKLSKKFNAKDTCSSLDNTPPTEGTEAWKLKECYEVMCALHPDSSLATKSIGKVYSELYSTLSEEIHCYPWSGESVSVASV